MKILHWILTPRRSGAEILVGHLTRLHARQGVSSVIASLDPKDASFVQMEHELTALGVQILTPARNLSRVARIMFVRRAIASTNPDIAFAHSIIPAFYSAISMTDVPQFSVLHDASEDDYQNWAFRLTEQLLHTRRKGAISVTQRAKEKYLARFPSASCHTIPNGIDLVPFASIASIRRRQSNRGNGCILQVGRINRVKNQEATIHALACIRSGGTLLKAIFVGPVEDENYRDELLALAESLGLAGQIEFAGSVDNIAQLLTDCVLYVMPSRQEAHSVALLEALTSGVPIVASEIPAFEFARNMGGVSLVNPDDALSFATKIRESMNGDSCFERDVSEFSIERTAKAYLNLAEEALA